MKKITDIINQFRYLFWPVLAIIWIFASGKAAAWFNNGRPLLDDPSAIYGYAFLVVPVINALFITSLYSSFLNNSLTREEYANATPGGKAADNAPELIVFLACLWFFHAHS